MRTMRWARAFEPGWRGWWRCHRRIVADYLLGDGETVFHLMGDDRIEPATMTKGARRLPSGVLVYPANPLQE